MQRPRRSPGRKRNIRWRPPIPFLLTSAVACCLGAPSAWASSGSSQSGAISNETTTTYWAYSGKTTPVRNAPLASARAIDTVHRWTEDRFPEVYELLAQKVYAHRTWFKIRLPRRPNGRTGWVPEQALGTL